MTDRVVRKCDIDDVARLRGPRVIKASGSTITIDTGGLMKTAICVGFTSLPWFSTVVDERKGVTDNLFESRWIEFRQIPPQEFDALFTAVNDVNDIKSLLQGADAEDTQKK